MASSTEKLASGPGKRPRSRKSIGYLPSPDDNAGAYDKENLRNDGTTALDLRPSTSKAGSLSKRSRSRSLGPGGIDALREDAGNRSKAAAIAAPKSILKPTIPLSPLKAIPVRKSGAASGKPKSPSQSPRKGATTPQRNSGSSQKTSDLMVKNSPVKPGKSSPSKQLFEAANMDQVQEQSGKDAEDEAKKSRVEALKQRDLRRKSMANRRVSFAPEATLHTWDMVEEMQDSTTSSASTSTTRRASIISEASVVMPSNSQQSSREEEPTPDDPPSTPPSQLEDDVVKESPASQRNLHQKKRRRRSSAVPPMNFNNPDDVFSSPYGSDSESEVEESPSSKAGAANGNEAGNMANFSPLRESEMTSKDDADSTDELGEAAMELADDEITAAFQPWSHKLFNGEHPKLKFSQDEDNTNPFSPAFKNATGSRSTSNLPSPLHDDDGEMSMDITRAIGFIAPDTKRQTPKGLRSGKVPTPRRSVRSRRRSSVESSLIDDASMDLTTALDAIQSNEDEAADASNLDANEELSMEFTSVFGRIQDRKNMHTSFQPQSRQSPAKSVTKLNARQSPPVEEGMDFTVALGGIIRSPVTQRQEREVEDDEDMEMTRAVGTILSVQDQAEQKRESEIQPTMLDSVSVGSPLRGHAMLKLGRSPSASDKTPTRRMRNQPSETNSTNDVTTPLAAPRTPTAHTVAVNSRPRTPAKTPPFKDVAVNLPSPTKLFKEDLQEGVETRVSVTPTRPQSPETQPAPQSATNSKAHLQRRASGVGIDRVGLGSPRVAMLLDRRRSIGENAAPFSPSLNGPRAVRFDNPTLLDEEVTRAREQDEHHESSKYILEQELDPEHGEKDATTTLKEAMLSMTPKRKRLAGRKSLAVGAAKGLLGTRPAELDDSDEDRTPKGMRSGNSSPVKRIKLSGPSPASRTNRQSILPRQSLAAIPVNLVSQTPSTNSPSKTQIITTPKSQGRFKDVELLPDAQLPLPQLGQQNFEATTTAGKDEEHEKIHLRDFLNLTSIRFIELSTTKRRHTVAPQADRDAQEGGLGVEDDNAASGKTLEDAAVAAACTVPLLELFQHSCRELKKYISEGRDVIRDIEAETYRDNPALFREYMSASPTDRATMDQQFKNMKTHARLLSKGMWYEWRMKLLEGLKEGLSGNAGELLADAHHLSRQEQILESVLPRVLEEQATLEKECAILQARTDEIASFDQEELKLAQQELLALDHEVRAKKQLTEDYERGFQDLDSAIEHAQQRKVEYVQSIREAQKLQEENRGWSVTDVNKLDASVTGLEAKHGWGVTSATAGTLTLVYRRELQIYFNVASFLPAAAASTSKLENSPISLIYIGDVGQQKPQTLTTEKRFFLQLMRAHIQCLVQRETEVKDLLRFVRVGWDKALDVSDEVAKLSFEFITNCSILSDERLAVRSVMLLPTLKTKVHVCFEIGAVGKGEEVEMGLTVKAEVIYGEKYKEDRMGEFLMSRVRRSDAEGPCHWVDAVRDLKKRLITQGKKH